MKKALIALFVAALTVPVFGQAPAPAKEQTPAEAPKKAPKKVKKSSKKKTAPAAAETPAQPK